MIDVTQLLSQIEDSDPNAAKKLLPLIYDELRKLAAARVFTKTVAPGVLAKKPMIALTELIT